MFVAALIKLLNVVLTIFLTAILQVGLVVVFALFIVGLFAD